MGGRISAPPPVSAKLAQTPVGARVKRHEVSPGCSPFNDEQHEVLLWRLHRIFVTHSIPVCENNNPNIPSDTGAVYGGTHKEIWARVFYVALILRN